MIGNLPSAASSASNRARPGPGTQWPLLAAGSDAGISHAAANPRKWSTRTTSNSPNVRYIRSTHQP